ncbi:MAG: hypothetical protein KAT76_00305 [Bacteroidales bacterium]|nr:hypothetical protein [Bacteroidales bacterium]
MAGALCGVVLDVNGNTLANATVAISAEDESLTNGIIPNAYTGMFNGFRGWLVDNILVTDKAPLKAANTTKVYGPDPKPRTN